MSDDAAPARRGAPEKLTRYAWLSIAAALSTMAIKGFAAWLTSSVGLLSDALESSVNLVAAVVALVALTVAAKPADEGHTYGHTKAEYFSAAIEGSMILVAAMLIVLTAVERLLHPVALKDVGAGLAVSVVAGGINLAVAMVLRRAGHTHRSITLEADSKHLMTDVWTSVGVIVAVGVVALTGIERLDPVIALLVAANIVYSGIGLIRRSATSQTSYGVATNLTKIWDAHQVTAGAALDKSKSTYSATQQECALNATTRNVSTTDCPDAAEETAAVTGSTTALGIYLADTYTLSPATHVTFAGRYNRSTVSNTLTDYFDANNDWQADE